jgi:hypothetical protein
VTRGWEGSLTGLATVRSPHLPDAAPKGAQSLIDRHAKGLRLWIRLSKDSWDMEGYGLDVRPANADTH